jgi:HEAT repeat protein
MIKNCPNQRIIFFILFVLIVRPAALHSEEKDVSTDIADIIHGILQDQNEDTQQEYIKKLRLYPSDAVTSRWLEVLESSWMTGTKVKIINALSEYNDRRFVMPVAGYLINPHYVVRQAAARTLKKIGDDRLYPVILKMAESSSPVHRIYFLEAMHYLYDRRFYSFIANMLHDESKSVRIYVLNCLRVNRVGESAGLIRNTALNDTNDEVRIAAIEALGVFRDIGSISMLHHMLNDRNREVRCESVKALAMIGAPVSAKFLSIRLLAEDDREIKELLIETLSHFKMAGDIRGVEKILLTDSNADLRIKSAYVLGNTKTNAALSVLLRALNDTDFRVRAEVCNSLSHYRNRLALTGLLEVLSRAEPLYVKTAALYAVKRINDKQSLLGLFELYSKEQDPVFNELLKETVREYIKRFI